MHGSSTGTTEWVSADTAAARREAGFKDTPQTRALIAMRRRALTEPPNADTLIAHALPVGRGEQRRGMLRDPIEVKAGVFPNDGGPQ